MAKVRALLLVALLAFPAAAAAQTIMGVVTDEDTGGPVAGARVEVLGAARPMAAETDANGLFLLEVTADTILLRITHPDYAPVDWEALAVAPEEAVDIEVRLGRQVVPLDPLVVTARRTGRLAGYYQRLEQPGFAHFVTRAQIASRTSAATTDLLRNVPGVHIRRLRTTTGTGDNLITMRGGQCIPAIYIDGVHVGQALGGGMDTMLRPETIEGVEVYTGSAGVPPVFTPHGCGIVAFWTRSGDEDGLEALGWKRLLFGGVVVTFLGLMAFATR